MSKACSERAERAELVDFCRNLVTAQQENLSRVEGWLSEWYGSPPSRESESREHASEEFRNFQRQMQSTVGPTFAEAFLRAMRLHHRDGFKDATSCQAESNRTNLKAFCGQWTVQQEQERQKINRWICEWFRDCAER